ncbi:MAG: hypothetical protein WCR58_10935 [Bacteroidales bacterium]|jgi:hypothetical protein|nr:hypothetical protein [Bacteroidales bacterium]
MDKLEFTLKQHTPIIHFQHDQDGATLRATEVKPKLDRFIIEKLTGKSGKEAFEAFKENAEWKKWLVGKGEHTALDYKMRIEARNSETTYIKDRHENSPMYFGNMGNKQEDIAKYKHFKFTNEEIHCTIFSFADNIKIGNNENSILELIQENLYEFFFINNFGTRQSKGYGSFTVDRVNGHRLPTQLSTKYYFQINSNDWKEVMAQISLFYKTLRSGINIGTPKYYETEEANSNAFILADYESLFYVKPIIFEYAKQKLAMQWDKKTIKESYFNNKYYYRKASRNERNKYNNGKSGLVETLGLQSQIEAFETKPDILGYSSTIPLGKQYFYDFRDIFGLSNDENWYSYGATIKKENIEIDRFKSPIQFKPIFNNSKYTVYIHLKDIPNTYKGKVFTIISKEHNQTKKNLKLQIPTEFKMDDFFNYISNEFDIHTHITKSKYKKYVDNNNLNYYQILLSIFSQFKSNKKSV